MCCSATRTLPLCFSFFLLRIRHIWNNNTELFALALMLWTSDILETLQTATFFVEYFFQIFHVDFENIARGRMFLTAWYIATED